MLTLQTRAHRSLKFLASNWRGLNLTLMGASLFVLGVCSTVETECPYSPASVVRSTSDGVTLPDRCKLASIAGSSVQRIFCDDGRRGLLCRRCVNLITRMLPQILTERL
jgi:hypothetical protein